MKKRTLTTFLLVATMMFGATTTTMAAGVPTVGTGTGESGATASITKDFELAEGLAIPEVTFEFTATPITEGAPTATIADISYGSTDSKGDLENNKYKISKNSQIVFGEFSHAGLYEYTVKETQGAAEGVTYSQKNYKLRVYVANKSDGDLYVKTITAEDENGKQEKILFTNTYVKDNQSLVIEKKTVGDLADKTKDFDFTITLIKSGTVTESTPTYTGQIGMESVSVTVGTPATFKLHDGEKLVFNDLPAGTRYVVSEIGAEDGYTPSIQVTENGVQGGVIQGNEKDTVSSANDGSSNLVGENENKVVFTNTFNDTPITGLILTALPFISLIGVAVLAFAVLLFLKKRIKA